MNSTFHRPNFHILTGCSGGGKSTLLTALQKQGVICVEEAGRNIVRQQQMIGGNAVPWKDCSAFCELVLSHNMYNFERMSEETKPVFFDRSIPEAIGYDHLMKRKVQAHHIKSAEIYRYNPHVFVLPPWPEIFVTDAERKHGFEEAAQEYDIQCKVYIEYGYTLVDVPKADVDTRVRFIIEQAARTTSS